MTESIKSFIKGMGSVLDIYPDKLKNPVQGTSDKERLASDWARVGSDLKYSARKLEREQNN